MIKQQILQDLRKTIEDLDFPSTDTLLSIPANSKFGDYSSNIALQLAKQKSDNSKQTALEIAKEILNKLDDLSYLEKVEIIRPGFINFFIKKEFLTSDLKEILQQGDNFGKSNIGAGKKARVEYISANPTGPLHIGNARGGPLGDVIANTLEFLGWEVTREYLNNDVGEQVRVLGSTIKTIALGKKPGENQYQGEYVSQLVEQLTNQIEGKNDEEVGKAAVEIIFKWIMEDVGALGIGFDLVVNESDLRTRALGVVEDLKQAGVVKKKERAWWLAPADEFLKDRESVIVKSDGGYTYFTADIVYHKEKFESGADLIIDVLGAGHFGHLPRIKAALASLGYDLQKLHFILYENVRVKRGNVVIRMSKRAGNFITAREVLDEVGLDAFRFYLLSFDPLTHIDFDLELLTKQSSKNPVFFVQYAYTRMTNILKKAQPSRNKSETIDFSLLSSQSEVDLTKHLSNFPELVIEIGRDFGVHGLVHYAIRLADLFHKFYETNPVLKAESGELIKSRLALVKASQIVLGNVLTLMGVTAPERM